MTMATSAVVALAPSPAQAARDGKLYAWDSPNERGPLCTWAGDDNNWDTCSAHDAPATPGGMRNRVGSLHNNGYGSAVNIYFNPNHQGAWACLGVGDKWMNLELNRERFTHRANPDNTNGHNLPINNNAASHKWVRNC